MFTEAERNDPRFVKSGTTLRLLRKKRFVDHNSLKARVVKGLSKAHYSTSTTEAPEM